MCLFNYTGKVILRKDKNMEAKTFTLIQLHNRKTTHLQRYYATVRANKRFVCVLFGTCNLLVLLGFGPSGRIWKTKTGIYTYFVYVVLAHKKPSTSNRYHNDLSLSLFHLSIITFFLPLRVPHFSRLHGINSYRAFAKHYSLAMMKKQTNHYVPLNIQPRKSGKRVPYSFIISRVCDSISSSLCFKTKHLHLATTTIRH